MQGWAEGPAGERQPPAQHRTGHLWLVSLSLWRVLRRQAATAADGRQQAAAAAGTSCSAQLPVRRSLGGECRSRAVAWSSSKEELPRAAAPLRLPQVWKGASSHLEHNSPPLRLFGSGRPRPAAEKSNCFVRASPRLVCGRSRSQRSLGDLAARGGIREGCSDCHRPGCRHLLIRAAAACWVAVQRELHLPVTQCVTLFTGAVHTISDYGSSSEVVSPNIPKT